jgi:hypothetical protein
MHISFPFKKEHGVYEQPVENNSFIQFRNIVKHVIKQLKTISTQAKQLRQQAK